MGNAKRRFTRWKGRIVQEVGDVTGDRRVEAKGDIERNTGREPDEHTLDYSMRRVRRRHGDTTVIKKP